MQNVAEIILQISQTSSTTSKQNILYKNRNNGLLLEVLKFIYNPYFRTNISEAKYDNAPTYPGYPVPKTADSLMQFLVDHPTGDSETCGIAKTWAEGQDTPEARWLAKVIITQDLQAGIGVTTLNKVYGSAFIPKISCMLGTPLDKVPERHQKWPYIVTEKLDGVRRIMIKQNGIVKLYSRSGHEDKGLVDIVAEAKWLPDNYAYDGELLAEGEFVDSIAQRQATNSIASTKGERTGLTFNIFDMVPVNEFLTGKCTESSYIRKSRLAAVLNDPTGILTYAHPEDYAMAMAAIWDQYDHKVIKSVPILGVAEALEDVEPIVQALWAAGKEGVMLNAYNAVYESKRTKTLVKMKKTVTYVLEVEGFSEGINKYEGMLGALVARYKDNYLQVGSGFTDQERWDVWENQDEYIGRLFEVEAFGESTSKSGLVSLNCPIFKRFL